MTFYTELGLDNTATQEQIKVAYKELAKKYHPDLNPGDSVAAQKMAKINEAYDTLKDQAKKQQYDNLLLNPAGNFTPFNDDMFRDIFSQVFTDNRSGFFHGFHNFHQQPKNPNVLMELVVSIKDAFFGGEKLVQFNNNGNNNMLNITIPKGAYTGLNLRLAEKAPKKNSNLPAGDLILKLVVQTDNDRFKLSNFDLISHVDISISDFVLQRTINFINLDNETIAVKLQKNILEPIKILGKGMTIYNQSKRGDLYIQPNILLPKNLTPEDIAFFEKMK